MTEMKEYSYIITICDQGKSKIGRGQSGKNQGKIREFVF